MKKGQKALPEAAERRRRTNFLEWASNLKWDECAGFLDADLSMSSRNREKQFRTLRQFKALVQSGNDLKQIIESGFPKHLAYFYSALAQGKFKDLPRERLIEDYHSGIQLDDLAVKYGLDRSHVTFLRGIYGIRVKGAKFLNRKRTEVPLTQRQKEIIYGSLMGDASYNSSSSVKFKHGDDQKNYLMWKYIELESVASKNSLLGEPYVDKRSGFNGIGWRFYTKANTDVETILNEFYSFTHEAGAGKKLITRSILDNLTPLSIAVWFMDDGMTDHHLRFESESLAMPTPFFCTECFSVEEQQGMVQWFKEKYSIEVEIVPQGERLRLKVSYSSVEAFLELIKPYMLPMFGYKINTLEAAKRRGSELEISFAEVKACPLGASFLSLHPCEQDSWIEKFLSYHRKRGFSELLDNDDVDIGIDEIMSFDASKLLINDGIIGFSSIGSRVQLSFFPHYWKAKAKGSIAIKDVFENDRYLAEILRSIIISGDFPRKRKLLSGLKYYRGNKPISSFMPGVAKAIYQKYAGANARILDFCSGYGGRLLGAIAAENVASYVGCDACFKSYIGINEMMGHVRRRTGTTKQVSFFNQGSPEFLKTMADDSFDLCFTSPPYFDAEEYDDSPEQSWIKYPSYAEWLENFLFPTVDEALRVAKKVVINIANTGSYPIADHLKLRAKTNGTFVGEDQMAIPKFGGGRKLEPLIIMAKRLAGA